jgi:hypothetical protein
MDDFRFPESLEPEMPQGIPMQIVEMMRKIHEQPDSRLFEWRVVLVDLRKADPGIIAGQIEKKSQRGV